MLSAMAVKTGEALWKRFIREYKLSVPIVSAPMAGVAGAELASSVARAGGMGFIGASQYEHGEQLQREFMKAVDLNGGKSDRLGIGLVGFTGGWLVDPAIALRPAAIWLAWGDYAEAASKTKAAGIQLIVMVNSAEEAVKAVELGADVVVAQGWECGGHGAGPTSTLCFVPEVKDALQQAGKQVPVLAAGGIADGRQVAGVLALGAAGAVMGTRFVATKESLYTEEKKLRYLSAKAVDTHRSSLHDQLGTVEQPQGIDGRLISSAFTSAYGTKAPTDEAHLKAAKEQLKKGMEYGDLDVIPLWCGGGVSMIHSIDNAEDVVHNVWSEARDQMIALCGSLEGEA